MTCKLFFTRLLWQCKLIINMIKWCCNKVIQFFVSIIYILFLKDNLRFWYIFFFIANDRYKSSNDKCASS